MTDRSVAVTVPVASVMVRLTSLSSPKTEARSTEAAPLDKKSATAPVTPSEKLIAVADEATKAAASASATGPSVGGSTVTSDPLPPQAARGMRRSGDNLFLLLTAAFIHFRRNLSRASPSGISTLSTSNPSDCKSFTSNLSLKTLAERSATPSCITVNLSLPSVTFASP